LNYIYEELGFFTPLLCLSLPPPVGPTSSPFRVTEFEARRPPHSPLRARPRQSPLHSVVTTSPLLSRRDIHRRRWGHGARVGFCARDLAPFLARRRDIHRRRALVSSLSLVRIWPPSSSLAGSGGKRPPHPSLTTAAGGSRWRAAGSYRRAAGSDGGAANAGTGLSSSPSLFSLRLPHCALSPFPDLEPARTLELRWRRTRMRGCSAPSSFSASSSAAALQRRLQLDPGTTMAALGFRFGIGLAGGLSQWARRWALGFFFVFSK